LDRPTAEGEVPWSDRELDRAKSERRRPGARSADSWLCPLFSIPEYDDDPRGLGLLDMATAGDPVDQGFVASLARPGGNITGLSSLTTDLAGKRLELLKEIIPKLSRVAVLWHPDAIGPPLSWKEIQLAAREQGLRLQALEVRGPEDLDGAFRAASRERAQALVALRSPIVVFERTRITELATKNRLPAIYDDRVFVETDGLMSYGTNQADLHRRAATYVDKILKGAKPADLPVEQPTKFELVINPKTAKALGLTIPPSLLLRADQVIE